MDLDWMEAIYLGCFFLGLGYALVSGLMSGVFSGGAEMAGHVDVSGGHVDVSGHAVSSGETVPVSPLSPITIAMFIAAFGGTGFVLKKYFELAAFLHLPLASLSGLLTATAAFYFFVRVLGISETSSAPSENEALGLEAEIVTAVPADGLGQISYTLRESRFNAPAKTLDGKELPSGSLVKIVKIVGGTFYVERVK